jgi:hypothetical protein
METINKTASVHNMEEVQSGRDNWLLKHEICQWRSPSTET